MPRKESVSRLRFEIWPRPSDVKFIRNHLCKENQSAKDYIENLVKADVAKRKKNLIPLAEIE